MRIIFSWGLRRRPREEQQALLAAAPTAQINKERQKEVGIMGQTIAEALFEEGRVLGEAAGQATGELRASRRLVRKLLENRFGAVPELIVQRIETATDVARLTEAALQVSLLNSPEELRI